MTFEVENGIALAKCNSVREFGRLSLFLSRLGVEWNPGRKKCTARFSLRKYKLNVRSIVEAVK